MMLFSSWRVSAVLGLVGSAWLAGAHMIDVPAGKKECFFEDLHVNDKMTVTYQVGGGGHLDIDFWLSDPINIAINKRLKESEGTASITAEKDGRYTYCFSNEMSTVTAKEVSFNVHGVIYVQDDGTVAPIEREIRELAIGLQAVKDEQEYIVIRERVHRNTAESTNDRVKWWSIAQAIVLVLVCGFQVYYLQSFFEVKRVI
ncbi:supernatant protein factor, C-terminal domain-containing protein [Ceratobasidium sp. AG-I]|nr:supernatant protein factor, C-terminal domain-containing protein [Ceratobasidium sp. AG-I]